VNESIYLEAAGGQIAWPPEANGIEALHVGDAYFVRYPGEPDVWVALGRERAVRMSPEAAQAVVVALIERLR
jgi:hypothetical protein